MVEPHRAPVKKGGSMTIAGRNDVFFF
jgi:hypothetical protein